MSHVEHLEPEEELTYEGLKTAREHLIPKWEDFFEVPFILNEPEIITTFCGPYGSELDILPFNPDIQYCFQPFGKYSQQNAHIQPISDQDAHWKEKLPEGWEDIIQWSKYGVRWETTEDLYHTLCRGFPLNDGEQWFFLDQDGRKCVAVSAREALEEEKWKWMFMAESRFEEAEYCNLPKFSIFCKFRSKLLSPETTYGAYLVYKLPECYKYVNPPPVLVVDKNSHPKEVHTIFLQTPQTPVISYSAKGSASNPSNMPKMKGLPKQRSDGWMEVQVHEFQTCPNLKMVSTRLRLSSYDIGLQGITVQCLEFRPV